MNFDKVKLIYFSPTNTTKTVLESIAQGMSIENIEHINLTPPKAEIPDLDRAPYEMAIIGAPVYGGRVPLVAIDRLKRFKARGTRPPYTGAPIMAISAGAPSKSGISNLGGVRLT